MICFIIAVEIICMISWQKRAQSDFIRPNVRRRRKKSKLHHYLKLNAMFCFGGFGTMNGQWVRVHALTIGEQKHDIACVSHTIRSILQRFLFDIA